MNYELELNFLIQRRNEMIGEWARMMADEFPSFYQRGIFTGSSTVFFDYLCDIRVPLQDHPIRHLASSWAQKLIEHGIPFNHIFRSSTFWRVSLFRLYEREPQANPEGVLGCLSILLDRLDEFMVLVAEEYVSLTTSQLEVHKEAITQLHDDRLNLIGKMAASMAHEIRNPLTSILGFLKLIREQLPERLSEEQQDKTRQYLSIVEAEFENINMHITGFLSFSKNRVAEEACVAMTAEQLLDSVISLLKPRFVGENVQLFVSICSPAVLFIQKVAVQQVIANVMNNGLDALCGVRGPKEMSVRCYREKDAYTIEISNNGPVIRQDMMDSLFEPFVTDKLESTGLGLAICRTIMRKNKGDISCDSTPGKTSFQLTFQLHESAAAAAAAAE
ncbi:Signal transduction histidine kinase [Paenibacillus sp. UNCCL117]|uniref:sensor histidine kinase n=1 Tax=unclassified Paenibacillus TaxID=185978 RepID=UPI000883835D|nr:MULTISPECIES: ATP-binding protein [unclassified Paenibacillus]SDC06034.1 Signal transduction histidine kinase [Paenibacillus sp. cl123]SFW37713.1 Signal transduction histidine kinase [Paenibacillus sp. UNCCL117]